jgi:hypothetical protein
MRTIYVIDTSTLMDSPKAIEELGEEWNAHIYLHQTVIRELDYHKEKGTPEKREKARVAAREINKWRKFRGEGPFPVNRSRGSYFHVYMQDNAAVNDLSDRADNKIVGLAVSLKAKYNGTDEILVVSKDTGMQTAAKNHGLWGLGYPFTPLEYLRISEKCDEEEIKSVYKKLLHTYHPDKWQHLNLSEVEQNYAKSRLLEIKTAYELLKDNGFVWYRSSQQAKTSDFYTTRKTYTAEDLVNKYCSDSANYNGWDLNEWDLNEWERHEWDRIEWECTEKYLKELAKTGRKFSGEELSIELAKAARKFENAWRKNTATVNATESYSSSEMDDGVPILRAFIGCLIFAIIGIAFMVLVFRHYR